MLLIFKILAVERLQSIKFCTRLLFPTRRKCTRHSFSVNIVTHYAQCQCSLETETSIDNERGRKRKWNFEVWDSGKRRQAWNYENTKYSDNPSVLSDKGFRIIAIIWTSRVKPINRDFLDWISEDQTMLGPRWFCCGYEKLKIVAVSFFCLGASYFC